MLLHELNLVDCHPLVPGSNAGRHIGKDVLGGMSELLYCCLQGVGLQNTSVIGVERQGEYSCFHLLYNCNLTELLSHLKVEE